VKKGHTKSLANLFMQKKEGGIIVQKVILGSKGAKSEEFAESNLGLGEGELKKERKKKTGEIRESATKKRNF